LQAFFYKLTVSSFLTVLVFVGLVANMKVNGFYQQLYSTALRTLCALIRRR